MKKGFTLIELLVVVLIIGILASIAVPQYQAAVKRAQYTQLMIGVKAIITAQEEYRLANGEYGTSFDDLTLDLGPLREGSTSSQWNLGKYACRLVTVSTKLDQIYCSNRKGERGGNSYLFDVISKKYDCYAYDGDKSSEKACLSSGAKYSKTGEYFKIYTY
ncbi:MAG: prepilin-type N-terminal cleavage/methylation domain-containing protein [Elusimicrobiaceae bacterium]|nr:prepilin-type N-terminal cleavage/methylation domain-containing protein [Elusimicrobiaceae bacterium]